ncbi:hypothetical protein [Endozoicomonas atrinae]|uniref:hypothetical protein n=1 Tax=Endozoicomonas atrinae TaxID=1333660 RepID=UPI000824E5B5|nr:hypothetical protein [Endozoicomonas atrinae]
MKVITLIEDQIAFLESLVKENKETSLKMDDAYYRGKSDAYELSKNVLKFLKDEIERGVK